MKYLFVFFAFSIFFACSSSRKSIENSTKDNETLADSIYSLRISFISIGSGTDVKTKQEYEKFLKQFEESNKVSILLDKATWGKEGEMDFCIKLTGLSNELRTQFIQETKNKLKDSKLVRLYENTTCKYKK